jgi:uncharacterized protein (TIGR02246 family)
MPVQVYENVMEPETVSVEEGRIRQLVADVAAAWNIHDVKGLSSAYADDADFTNVIGMSLHGRQAIEEQHAKIFETIFRKSHLIVTDIRVRFLCPKFASVDIRWEMTGALDWDGKEIPLRKGLLNWIATRTGDCWQIKVMHNQELTPLRY